MRAEGHTHRLQGGRSCPFAIQNNIEAFNAHRQAGQDRRARCRSRWRSSPRGYRINRAADDAAGLAIREKLRAQIGGLTRPSATRRTRSSSCRPLTAPWPRCTRCCSASATSRCSTTTARCRRPTRPSITAEVAQLCAEISQHRHGHQVQRHRPADRHRDHHLPGRRRRRRDDLASTRSRCSAPARASRRRLGDLQLQRLDGHAGRRSTPPSRTCRPMPARPSARCRTGSSTRSTTWPTTRRT